VTAPDPASTARASLARLLGIAALGTAGAAVLLAIALTGGHTDLWLVALSGAALALTALFAAAALTLRRSLGAGGTRGRRALAAASALNLLLLGVPVLAGLVLSGSFGLGMILEGYEGGGTGLVLTGFAVLGALFFWMHLRALYPAAQARTASPKAVKSRRETGSLAALYSGCHCTDSVKPGASRT
jgi:hypothetical protein